MTDGAEEWSDPERVTEYLSREIPHRLLAEEMLLAALSSISSTRRPSGCTSASGGKSVGLRTIQATA
jgi:hypothetical protein